MKKGSLDIVLFGATGRMGQEIRDLIEKPDSGFNLTHALGKNPTSWVQLEKDKVSKAVAIDFSQPDGLARALMWCVEQKIPLVTGTTGFSASLEKQLTDSAKEIPLFVSPNMSLGLNLLLKAIQTFAKDFQGSEVEIEEIHHRHKKDKPSGTAKLIHGAISEVLPQSAKLGHPVSLRGGGVFGVHKAYFFDDSEWICFEHQALNRSVFAKGALRAAQWISKQKPGYYNMNDLIRGLKLD